MSGGTWFDVGLYGDYMVMNIMRPGPPYDISATHHTDYLYIFNDVNEIDDLIEKLLKLKQEVL